MKCKKSQLKERCELSNPSYDLPTINRSVGNSINDPVYAEIPEVNLGEKNHIFELSNIELYEIGEILKLEIEFFL